jgi:hypothetical protein
MVTLRSAPPGAGTATVSERQPPRLIGGSTRPAIDMTRAGRTVYGGTQLDPGMSEGS